jgi:uncharacterized protein with GYD domain
MSTFLMRRLSHAAFQSPSSLEHLEREVMERVRAECVGVKWSASYTMLGPCDYLDVFTAPDIAAATKVATIIRTFTHVQTEAWAAREWTAFNELARYLPPAKQAA